MNKIQESVDFETGQKIADFKVTRKKEIPDIACTLIELEHACGAKVLHLQNDDEENVFNLSFQTLPQSDNGVAHILEHTVLCGSKKFPVKDPFFSMNRRSLNTFMNAFTGADFTCYPAASQIPKDFYNLLEVYLDAVFNPLLSPLSFSQEGHRLEMDNEKLIRSGVVYNEMKGAFTSPDSRLWKHLQRELFNASPYGYESGGDPKSIPSLSHEDLVAFHKKFYHPSRCLFFFYGNLPLQRHLDFIQKNALEGLEKADTPPTTLKKQKRFVEARRIQGAYPVLKEEKEQAILAFSWLSCSILEQEKTLALEVVDHLLTGTDASILRQDLLQSGLCKQVDSFIEEELFEIPFVFLVKGCEAKDANAIEEVIFKCLNKIAKDGLGTAKIEAAIHQIEMQRREISSDHYPLGLNFFMRAALLKQHGGQSDKALEINEIFKNLRQKFEDPQYLKDLIKETFLDNSHFVRLEMTGDTKLSEKEENEEKQELQKIQDQLKEEEKKKIIEENEKLNAIQEEKEDLSILPKVSLEDIPKKGKDFLLQKESISHVDIYSHHCFCNQIIYADLVFPIAEIQADDLSYLKLFCYLIPQLGNGGRDYKETLDLMQSNTGGIGIHPSMHNHRLKEKDFQIYLSIGGKALIRKSEAFFNLLKDYFGEIDFKDHQRIRELIEKLYVNLHSNLGKNGLKYASKLATSALCNSSFVQNQWSGLPYYKLIKDLAENFPIEKILEKMLLFQKMLQKQKADLIISSDPSSYAELQKAKFYGLTDLVGKEQVKAVLNYKKEKPASQAKEISSSVAFNCLAMKGKSYFDSKSPALCLASTIFENQTLHKKIREQGGAYGSAAVNQLSSGNFYFYSYRDPQIAETLEAFKEAVEQVIEEDIDTQAIEEAKLGILQGIDHPVCPSSRAITSYFWEREGKDFSNRQIFRNRVIQCSREEIIEAARNLLEEFESSCFVSFSGKEVLEKENKKLEKLGKEALPIFDI